jgi:transcriptional regulator with XRE-family HTH domain
MSKKEIDPVDVHVGSRMRTRRQVLGVSQAQLGDAVGVTFQQIQKYEDGGNRVSASRLQQIANVLQVSASFFFEGVPSLSVRDKQLKRSTSTDYLLNFVTTSEGNAFAKAFMRINSSKSRRRVINLAKEIAADQ